MSILWIMEWAGLTTEQYDQLREAIDWEGNVPDGLNINREYGATHPEALVAAVKSHRAHLGIADPALDHRLIDRIRLGGFFGQEN